MEVGDIILYEGSQSHSGYRRYLYHQGKSAPPAIPFDTPVAGMPRATLSPPMALLVDYQTKITLNMLFTHSQNGLNTRLTGEPRRSQR